MVYLDEMANFLLDELDLRVIEATVFRVLRRLRWSRKQYRRVARESDYVLKVGMLDLPSPCSDPPSETQPHLLFLHRHHLQ